MSRNTVVGIILAVLVIAGVVWLINRKDKTVATPVLSVSAMNVTKNSSATNQAALPGDTIVYTLTAENHSDKVIEGYIMEVSIADISDKAALMDASGAAYNSATNSLVWTALDIQPNDSITKQFTVRVNPQAAGSNNMLKITFNNEISIPIQSASVAGGSTTPTPQPTYNAPKTGPSEIVPIILALMATIGIIAYRKSELLGITFRKS